MMNCSWASCRNVFKKQCWLRPHWPKRTPRCYVYGYATLPKEQFLTYAKPFADLLADREQTQLLQFLVNKVAHGSQSPAARPRPAAMLETKTDEFSKSSGRTKLESLLGVAETEELVELCTTVMTAWSDIQIMHDLISEQQEALRASTQNQQQTMPSHHAKELEELQHNARNHEIGLLEYLAWLEETRVSCRRRRSTSHLASTNAILECGVRQLRPALGLFDAEWLAEDLVKLYQGVCALNNWTLTPLGVEENSSGTIESMAFEISGAGAFTALQSEAGVHRFIHLSLRPCNTAKQQKIFTSTVLVTLLAEADPISDKIPDEDVEITYLKHGGPGGTQGTKSTSGVSLLHKPTGLRATCRETRGPAANCALALQLLHAKVVRYYQSEREREHEEAINAMIGTGETADRIRTYDYLNGKITDHRCKITLSHLDEIMTTGVGFDTFLTGYKHLRRANLAVHTAQRIRRCLRTVSS